MLKAGFSPSTKPEARSDIDVDNLEVKLGEGEVAFDDEMPMPCISSSDVDIDVLRSGSGCCGKAW